MSAVAQWPYGRGVTRDSRKGDSGGGFDSSWLVVVSLAVTAVLSLIDAVFDPTAPAWQVLRGLSAGVVLFALIWWVVSRARQSGSTSGP